MSQVSLRQGRNMSEAKGGANYLHQHPGVKVPWDLSNLCLLFSSFLSNLAPRERRNQEGKNRVLSARRGAALLFVCIFSFAFLAGCVFFLGFPFWGVFFFEMDTKQTKTHIYFFWGGPYFRSSPNGSVLVVLTRRQLADSQVDGSSPRQCRWSLCQILK